MPACDMRIQLSWFAHWKRRRLRRDLGGDGEAAIIALWAHCAANKPDGVIGPVDDDTLAGMAEYDGDPAELRRVLTIGCRLIDDVGGVLSLHDWVDHQPWAATSPERVANAKTGALARWHREGKHHKPVVGCPLCTQDRPAPAEDPAPAESAESEGDLLSAIDVETAGAQRFGRLGGTNIGRLRQLTPIAAWEWKAALETEARSWAYVLKVIEALRSEAEKPPIPRARGKPRARSSWEEGSALAKEWAREQDKIEAERLRGEDGAVAGVLPATQ